jgi:hypothetical protein
MRPKSAGLERFLYNPACQLPYWENNTPGKTKLTELENNLSRNPEFQITYQDKHRVEWHQTLHEGGHAVFNGNEDEIDNISP